MTLQTTRMTPAYGINYDIGYVGFTRPTDRSVMSSGITYFTRWDCLSDIEVSHTFIVAGPNACVEAHLHSGVRLAPLHTYFNGPYEVFFRKPVLWSANTGHLIASLARRDIGKAYDWKLILGHALGGTLFIRWLNRRRWRMKPTLLNRLLDTPDAFICSEHVAHVFKQFVEYCNKGCLKLPAHTINPQMLFEDAEVFEEWKNKNQTKEK